MAKTFKVVPIHEILPQEIFHTILKKLSYKSICLARLTCKEWKEFIDDFKIVDACMAKTYVIIAAGGLGKYVVPNDVKVIGDDYVLKELPRIPSTAVQSSLILHNGSMLSFGVDDCFSLKNGTWKKHSIINEARTHAGVVTIKSASFAFGGYGSEKTFEYLPKDSSEWIMGKSKIPGEGFYGGCVIATKSEQEILLIGGTDTGQRILKFNINDHNFEELPSKLIVPRSEARCAYIPGTNKVIITGGCHEIFGMELSKLSSTEILDLDNGSIVTGSSMTCSRSIHGIGILTINDMQRLAVFGGYNLDTIELYDIKTQKWELSEMKLKYGISHFGFVNVNLRDVKRWLSGVDSKNANEIELQHETQKGQSPDDVVLRIAGLTICA